MFRTLAVGLVGLVLLGLSAQKARCQQDLLSDLYGSGVHDYFSEDYLKAYEKFTQVIEQGTSDPRVFYFRGLTFMELGRPEQAEADFRKGAEIEAASTRFFPVGRSLERIQGEARVMIENARRDAKIALADRQQRIQRARYQQLEEAEGHVLRRPPAESGVPVERVAPPAADVGPTVDSGDPTDPFGDADAERLGMGEGEAAPDRPTAPAATDPFGDVSPAAPAADPFGGDPFGVGGDSGTAPAAPADPFGGGAPAADPFGGGAPAADPFGGGAPAADPFGDAPAADPFGGGAPAADPFGDAPAAADPFGDAPAAEPGAGADPFGGDAPAADDLFGDLDTTVKEEDDRVDPFEDDPAPDAAPADAAPAAGDEPGLPDDSDLFGDAFGG